MVLGRWLWYPKETWTHWLQRLGVSVILEIIFVAGKLFGPTQKIEGKSHAKSGAQLEQAQVASARAKELSDVVPEQEQKTVAASLDAGDEQMKPVPANAVVANAGEKFQATGELKVVATTEFGGPAVAPPAGVKFTSPVVESVPLLPSPPQLSSNEAGTQALVAKYVKPVGLVTAGVVSTMTVWGMIWLFNKWKNSGGKKKRGGKKKEPRHAREWIVHEG